MIEPSKKLVESVGGGSFSKIGMLYYKAFTEKWGLKPNDKVLDVGCGVGRIALPLTLYLKNGLYEGFDVNKDAIDWCKNNIEPDFTNFHFKFIDLYNNTYNPNGMIKPDSFTFPYENEYFDFIILTSVFTHMLPEDVSNFVKEISRVLKMGGCCYASYFILNQNSKTNIQKGISRLNFKTNLTLGSKTTNEEKPETAIAHEEEYIKKLYNLNGLEIKKFNFGTWSDSNQIKGPQDVIFASKLSP